VLGHVLVVLVDGLWVLHETLARLQHDDGHLHGLDHDERVVRAHGTARERVLASLPLAR